MGLTTTQEALERYCDALRAAGLDAPWSRPGPLIASKAAHVQPCLWRWTDIESLLRRSAEFVSPDAGAERRILRLMNPGVPERTSTHTISVAVQYLLPGETAPSHRHTPNAIRFMLQGRGAYTDIESHRYHMEAGDLVLTPSMTWHEHGNSGSEPVMWVDGLDSPVVRYLEILSLQGRSQAAAAFPSATHVGPGRTIHFPWAAAQRALVDQSMVERPSPYDDVVLEYGSATGEAPVLPTLGCYLQMLRPGVETKAHRHTSSGVYHVVRGRGWSLIDGTKYEWGAGDFFAVPPMVSHAHANPGGDPAILFSLQDVPLLRALGMYHESPA
jgi:gentisate 1,2-dioxygenase